MARINILGSSLEGEDDVSAMKNYHNAWRETNRSVNHPFFALYKGFKDKPFLRDLDAGALRLYLYFGFVANNDYGNSWHSIERIASYFGKQSRTIDTWIKALVDADLIYRVRDDKRSSTTILIPYTDTLMRLKPRKKHNDDNQELIDDLLNVVRSQQSIYGPIVGVYHIFHWGIAKRNASENTATINFLLIITRRPDDVLVGHRYELKRSTDQGISCLQFKDPVIFNSPYLVDKAPVTGIAVRHTARLKSKESDNTWLNLLRDLVKVNSEILDQHERVEYGSITKVFDPEDQRTEVGNEQNDDTQNDEQDETE